MPMGMRAPSGSQPSRPKKTNCAMIASQNTGKASPEMEMNRAKWSGNLSRRTEERIPSGMPIRVDITKATAPSSMVAGKYRFKSSTTGRLVVNDVPRSPWTRLPRYVTYCWGSGSFRPYCSRIFSTALLPARGPAMSRAGSPGMICESPNVNSESPKRTKIRKINLRTISLASMSLSLRVTPRSTRCPNASHYGSGRCPRHAIEVETIEVERIGHKALDVLAENSVTNDLAVIDHGWVLLGENVLSFLH